MVGSNGLQQMGAFWGVEAFIRTAFVARNAMQLRLKE